MIPFLLSVALLVSGRASTNAPAPMSQSAQSPSPQTSTDSNSAHGGGTASGAGQPSQMQTAPANADPAVNARARALNLQLRCPVCQGSSIQESPSPEATAMKQIVRERIAAGETDDQIKEYFVSRYGDWILLAPPAKGVNLIVYVLPVVVLLSGGFFVYRTARKWTTG